MNSYSLEDFTRGWFIGDFEPSLHKTRGFEIAVQRFNSGDKEAEHVHRIATEFTVIVSGKVRMNDEVYTAGDIIEIPSGKSASFEAIEDTVTTVVKIPCAPGDKYMVKGSQQGEINS